MDYRKINRLWQSATLFLAPILITLLIWLRPSMDPYQWLLWLHLPLLMLHEAEEYVLSPMSFKAFLNLKTFVGSKTDPNYPLDEGYVFQVNIMIAWPVVILGAILAPVIPWLGFSMIWFELIVNNIMHTILFQGAKPSYNPGLITNSFLLLPFGTWTLLTAVGFFTPLDWVLSVVAGGLIVAYFATKTRGRLARMQQASGPAAS
jgi:3',5'-cyclic AMP phosphodiesterase CpdA